ncbi:MAG: peptidase E [Mycobacteriales bacterium]
MSVDGRSHVLAIGGGGFTLTERYGARPGPLVEHALSLTGSDQPKVCALYTATADDPARIAAFYAAWGGTGVRPSHLALFPMPSVEDVRAHLLDQDALYVGGGSVANLLAVWRVHGLDEVMRDAWQAGVVLFGVSAGSLCWFAGGTTDSFGPQLRPFTNGLGLIPASTCPHYDSEARRRPLYQRLVATGALPPGVAADDGVGLHYVGTELAEAVADRPDAAAWQVERSSDGTAIETRLEPRQL